MTKDNDIANPKRATDPSKVAELAADIYELVQRRDVLIAEGAMALFLALDHQITNCESAGCKCGDIASERARKEMAEDVGRAATQLFELELDAREW